MITAINIFLIGAADRNVGKTEFACTLIKKLVSEGKDAVAIKVPTIKEKDGPCPRGGKGCKVCSSLSGSFCIEEEKNVSTTKDTSRMLKAGAKAVFWLKVMNNALEYGISVLLSSIEKQYGENIPIICESNSLRKVINPGLFFILNRAGNENIKDSCKKVEHLADKKVTLISSEKGFDFDVGKISFIQEGWCFKNDASVIILAGGKSSRMGIDKAQLSINGKAMIHFIIKQLSPLFKKIIIGANDLQKFSELDIKVVPDQIQGVRPLMAIYSCLKESENDINFITGCDMPNMNRPLICQLFRNAENFDIVVPRLPSGKIEPLYAIYKKKLSNLIFELLVSKNYKIRLLFDKVSTCYVDIEKPNWYFNLNTISDYMKFLKTVN